MAACPAKIKSSTTTSGIESGTKSVKPITPIVIPDLLMVINGSNISSLDWAFFKLAEINGIDVDLDNSNKNANPFANSNCPTLIASHPIFS